MVILGCNFDEEDIDRDFMLYRFILQLLCHLGVITNFGASYSLRNVIRHSPIKKTARVREI